MSEKKFVSKHPFAQSIDVSEIVFRFYPLISPFNEQCKSLGNFTAEVQYGKGFTTQNFKYINIVSKHQKLSKLITSILGINFARACLTREF